MLYYSCVCVSIRMHFVVEVVVTVRGRHESARGAVCLIECSLSVSCILYRHTIFAQIHRAHQSRYSSACFVIYLQNTIYIYIYKSSHHASHHAHMIGEHKCCIWSGAYVHRVYCEVRLCHQPSAISHHAHVFGSPECMRRELVCPMTLQPNQCGLDHLQC